MKNLNFILLTLLICGSTFAADYHYSNYQFVEIQSAKSCYETTHFYLSDTEREAMLVEKFADSRIDYDAEKLAEDLANYEASEKKSTFLINNSKAIKAAQKCISDFKKDRPVTDFEPNYSDEQFTLIVVNMICAAEELQAAPNQEQLEILVTEELSTLGIDFSATKFDQDDKYRRAYTQFYEQNSKSFRRRNIVCS
ncbi:hypothetical protein [Reinekea thalattae]|uniref:Uncharacterized protein n=1 Tax=Reinekea thalattae TaxID=2593301 RepID=A0A5C8ZBJ5_9GAMM|nr:hypothetical protein [Reinekea thalattae]TXR54568.1 hypothetical protein FME95_08535 [Reinekea thalattae]